jgi:YidC/Oxa1 family membrane protein insertase
MDRNSIIGILIIAGIFVVWGIINRPSAEEIERQKQKNDSIALERLIQEKKQQEQLNEIPVEQKQIAPEETVKTVATDTLKSRVVTLENERIKVFLSERGGRPLSVELKNYRTYDSLPLRLFDGDSSKLGFVFFENNRPIHTQDLFFTYQGEQLSLISQSQQQHAAFRYSPDDSSYIEFRYSLAPGKNQVDMEIEFHNMEKIYTQRTDIIDLDWVIHSPQQEKGRDNELLYTTLYYKFYNGDVEFFRTRSKKQFNSEPLRTQVEWIAYKDQFFSSVLMADESFIDADVGYENKPVGSKYLKRFESTIGISAEGGFRSQIIPLHFYFGPNKYKLLKKQYGEKKLQDLVTVGSGIIKWINQIVIINLFDFLNKGISNYGIIILIMTIIIKVALLPLTFKSYMSTAKMKVLKPQIDEINKKIPKEKAMERQQATMALYKKVGVSPLGGCLPMLLQMPILFAMFRFFPTSIELRQQSFLWAHDLSTYDAIIEWQAHIPLISNVLGNHLSLFTLLMTVSTIISMKFNSQANVSNQQMPGMQTMMYIMPVMFMFILNKYSSGLTYYYFLANMITIGQNYLFKQFIDEDELLKKLESKKTKTKKKSKFQQRMEEMAKKQGYKPSKR